MLVIRVTKEALPLREELPAPVESDPQFLERITKAFYGHAGRPGQIGGSLPRGEGGEAAAYAKTTETSRPKDPADLVREAIPDPEKRKLYTEHVAEVVEKLNKGQETYKIHSKEGGGKGGYTERRLKLQREVMQEVLDRIGDRAKPEKGKAPTLIVLAGRGGSGKSSFKNSEGKDSAVYDETKNLVIDADEIKNMLAVKDGYNGVGHLAALYHEESGHVVNRLMKLARERGLNVVYDATMKSDKPYLINNFKRKGYRVEAHFMHLPREEAARRALKRYASGTDLTSNRIGRLVMPDLVYKNTKNESNFDKAVRRGVDSWSLWDNQGPEGSQPRFIGGSENMRAKAKKD